MKVPPWLESLLSTPFFTNCSRHRETSRNECNMYCLDCMNDAFCFYCRSSAHRDHLVIQKPVGSLSFLLFGMQGIRQKGNTSFVLSNRNNEEESREGRVEEMYNNRCKAHSNSRRRKGIPHRAPFGP
ncbi:hypothetical protein V6N12_009160 [Hibiscus sabdariffa]|uniref:B box-type domain-containing protein n=1 Tax=Hibiscus sabdariffa TaxID=183260 RepID=A0ABR2C6A7_9ROSI